jgi:hypothetical protein
MSDSSSQYSGELVGDGSARRVALDRIRKVNEADKKRGMTARRSLSATLTSLSVTCLGGNKGGAWSDVHLYVAVAIGFFYYSLLITNGSFDFFNDPPREIVSGVVFNSMLWHLLQGDFTVDPDAIRLEAYVRDGKTYTYFGIAPAFLRLPLLFFRDFATIDITPLSMVIATCVAAYFKCASLLLIRRQGDENPTHTALYGLLLISIIFGGPQIQFLKPSIYQEVICWAMAIASAFIYCGMRGLLLPSGFSRRLLVTLACLAGVALLTRVTAGLGLYAALGLLLLSLGTRACFPRVSFLGAVDGHEAGKHPSILQWLMSREVVLPSLVLTAFVAVCALVNYGRWGNPLVVADLRANLLMVDARIAVVDQHGEFNLLRVPYSIMYYVFPFNFLFHGADGAHLFNAFRRTYYDGVEPPLSSFFGSDPATLVLAAVFVCALIRNNIPVALDRRHTTALLVGLAAPLPLILTYYFLAFRFRGEFYPLMEFAAMLGFYVMIQSNRVSQTASWRPPIRAIVYAVIIGIAVSHDLVFAYQGVEWTQGDKLRIDAQAG